MIPFWEMYSASEDTTEPLPNASESSNPKSEFQSDTKRHNFAWIRRLSPIIGISILGVASSCFGYYTARNQSRIAQNQFLIAQNPGYIVWPIPGIEKVIVYRDGSSSRECARKNLLNKSGCEEIPDNTPLVVNPQNDNFSFRIIECADQQTNVSSCDKKVRNKLVDADFLVCFQGCKVRLPTNNDSFLREIRSAKENAVSLISAWRNPPNYYAYKKVQKPRDTAW